MDPLPSHPALYEINTRVWLRRFDTPGKKAGLDDVPDSLWDEYAGRGMDIIWLMGVWKTCAAEVHEYDMGMELQEAYSQVLPDWREQDVIGSPYAIDDYIVSDDIGGHAALLRTKNKLHARGLRLMLDFVPNHFSRASGLITTDPHVFIRANAQVRERHPDLFFQPDDAPGSFALGRDPFFPPWQDTVQVDYSSVEARRLMTDRLLSIAEIADAVRCDMAMLVMNDIFTTTWGELTEHVMPTQEFWPQAIAAVKAQRPDFVFMAEAYWDREWSLQQQGFDYTYDKYLTDLLENGEVGRINGHLHADLAYQLRSVRFLENHDEPRAITALGQERSLAAAVIVATLPGLCFYHDGQLTGRKARVPVQLGREPDEMVNLEVQAFYNRILDICALAVIKDGQWRLLVPHEAWQGNTSFQAMLAWQWSRHDEHILVVVNYSQQKAQCRLNIPVPQEQKELAMHDMLNDVKYRRLIVEIAEQGLYIELEPCKAHIFRYLLKGPAI